MVSTCKHGYRGMMTLPNPLQFGMVASSIYIASDQGKGEIVVIPLTIGCFHDIYRVFAKESLSGVHLRLMPLSTNYDYISDIYNLVTVFNRRGIDTKWIFPTRPRAYNSEEYELNQIVSSDFTHEIDPSIRFQFIESGIEDLYDLKIFTDISTKYFSLYMTEEKYNLLTEDPTIDEIHMCADTSRHGGICAMDLNKRNPKVRLFNVDNSASYHYLRKKFLFGYDFLDERWE